MGVSNTRNSTIFKQFLPNLRKEEKILRFERSFGLSLETLASDLLTSIEEDGLVPYVIGTKERYRTTPLATTLYSLWDAELVPPKVVQKMQKGLLFLRDKIAPLDHRPPHQKLPGDEEGWCVGEGVSVWATSMALIALFHTGFKGDESEKAVLARSTEWLANQRDTSGGWKYQNTVNCAVTVPMTALAVRASKALVQEVFPKEKKWVLTTAIDQGTSYLLNRLVRHNDNRCSWTFRDIPSITATLWALQALDEAKQLERSLCQQADIFRTFCYPFARKEWEPELFVHEAGAKYSKHKNFFAFMPSHIPTLLALGISPLQPEVVGVIRRVLKANTSEWRIPPYDQKPCTFSHAMALQSLVKWQRACQECSPSTLIQNWNESRNAALQAATTNKIPGINICPPGCARLPTHHSGRFQAKQNA